MRVKKLLIKDVNHSDRARALLRGRRHIYCSHTKWKAQKKKSCPPLNPQAGLQPLMNIYIQYVAPLILHYSKFPGTVSVWRGSNIHPINLRFLLKQSLKACCTTIYNYKYQNNRNARVSLASGAVCCLFPWLIQTGSFLAIAVMMDAPRVTHIKGFKIKGRR